MAGSWTSKSEYAHLSAELATAEKRAFESRALPLIRVIWPDAVGTPELLSFDNSGVDHLSWSKDGNLHLIVQCKGYSVSDKELGHEQIKLCADSINSFRTSGLKTKTYLLLHNRTGQNRSFHQHVEAHLRELVRNGCAEDALLWDRQTFLRKVFDAMLERMRKRTLVTSQFNAKSYRIYEPDLCPPLEHIPYKVSQLTVGARHLLSSSDPTQHLDDPTKELLSCETANLSVMIGEAGFGKTTTALRTFATTGRRVFYVRAATFSQLTVSTKGLLEQCFDSTEVLNEFEETDHVTVRRIIRPVVEYVLKSEKTPVALIIDGLDESVFFTRRGGIQELFNMLQLVRVPVILMARTEYWYNRLSDFAAAFGMPSTHRVSSYQPKNVHLIELLPWSTKEILALAKRYHQTLIDPSQKRRIAALIDTIINGKYENYYGDIPRRPLFLRFILETAAEGDIRRVNRADLFTEWASQKIKRDFTAPLLFGGRGRTPILTEAEGLDSTTELAFLAMRNAAYIMTDVNEGNLEILPDCTVEEVRATDSRLHPMVDHTGLVLNSLLVPVQKTASTSPSRIRFAHRAFQEFFLAQFLSQNPEVAKGLLIPDSVQAWLTDMHTA